jgi:hypothetical protein
MTNDTSTYIVFYASWARVTYNKQRCIFKLWFGQKFFNWAFEYIFLHLFFNRQQLQADEFQIRHIANSYCWWGGKKSKNE